MIHTSQVNRESQKGSSLKAKWTWSDSSISRSSLDCVFKIRRSFEPEMFTSEHIHIVTTVSCRFASLTLIWIRLLLPSLSLAGQFLSVCSSGNFTTNHDSTQPRDPCRDWTHDIVQSSDRLRNSKAGSRFSELSLSSERLRSSTLWAFPRCWVMGISHQRNAKKTEKTPAPAISFHYSFKRTTGTLKMFANSQVKPHPCSNLTWNCSLIY